MPPTTPTTPAPKPQDHRNTNLVIVVRHGERLDYTMRDNGENWIPTATRPWDPPLTNHGKQQATALGDAISDILTKHKFPNTKISAIYSSPLLRCRQTAAFFSEAYRSEQQKYNKATDDNGVEFPMRVRVEHGLAESMNESWYRSWALQGADSTWGYHRQEEPLPTLNKSTLHPASIQPIQNLLNNTWGNKDNTNDDPNMSRKNQQEEEEEIEIENYMDSAYTSKTSITTPYSLDPPNFESAKLQQQRMHRTLDLLYNEHWLRNSDADDPSSEAIVLVSHGAFLVFHLLCE